MGRAKRPKRFHVPKRVAKFDCMHVPGRRQNIFFSKRFRFFLLNFKSQHFPLYIVFRNFSVRGI